MARDASSCKAPEFRHEHGRVERCFLFWGLGFRVLSFRVQGVGCLSRFRV